MVLAFVSPINAQICGSSFDAAKLRQSNPQAYREYLRIENLTLIYRQSLTANPNGRLISETGVITIPVVFHVLHRGPNSDSNIPEAEITEQLTILNQCYSQTNDQSAINSNFLALAGNPNFKFELACVDPDGYMYENFMDYTNEDCGLRMFTRDQVTRMRAVFQPGGPRRSFIDNYFKLLKGYSDCNSTSILFGVRTAFCAANGNINWTTTGPGTITPFPGFTYSIVSLNIPQGTNGGGIMKASFGNFTDEIPYYVGYGVESSTYNPNYYNSGNIPTTSGSVNMTSYNNWTYGKVSFTGATGLAKNWRLASCNSCNTQTYFSGSGNNFGVYLTQPYAFATIRAEIPTACGDKTVEYSFLGGYLNPGYTISPNPADNEITISASLLVDPNNRASSSSTPAYEVQIFNSFSQLLKKMKVKKDDRDVTIDVSRFPSNQFYTVKLISNNDVQTKSFFKQ